MSPSSKAACKSFGACVERNGIRRFIFGSELSPNIVDADEYAEDIGVVVEAVLLPSGLEVANGVAGDSGVYYVKVVRRIFA